MVSLVGRFLRDRDGNISIIGALALPVLIGVVALVAEFGHGLLTRAENQRVADLAAYAGALAYTSTSSTSSMTSAVNAVAALNGIPSSQVTASLVSSPKTPTNQAVTVEISTSNFLLLAPILGASSSLPVNADAYAEVGGSTPACIIALNAAQTGVTLSGGTSISAPQCAVASNNTVTVPCGTTITTKAVNYNSSAAPSQPCGGIQAASGTVQIKKTATADPLSGNTGVSTATSRIATVAALTSPAAPTVPAGTNIDFGWTQSATTSAATTIGCTATWASGTSTWTLTCPAGSTRNFGNVTVGGGIKVVFNTSGTASNVYNFSGPLSTAGTWTFGPGTYNLSKGLSVSGTATFAAGTYNIGTPTTNCSGGIYSICQGGGSTLTFAGPSTFVISSGISSSGGATTTLGSGTGNSYQIGASSNGYAINVGGGSKLTLVDATGNGHVFKAVGNIVSAGGSCLTLPAADQHDIKGNFDTSGGSILGAGVYTINGYMALASGGATTCNGTSVGLSGSGVTLVLSGTSTPSSGTCSGRAFCIGAGFTNVTLTAPTSGTTAKLVVIGPAANTAGALFTGGASGVNLSGVFYFPSGQISLSGGAGVGNGTGQCLQLIGSNIALTGGTAAASACITSSSSGGTVMLVQ
jgi:Flp pilus assembly protein TadG